MRLSVNLIILFFRGIFQSSLMQTYTALGFYCVIRCKGYLMTPMVLCLSRTNN